MPPGRVRCPGLDLGSAVRGDLGCRVRPTGLDVRIIAQVGEKGKGGWTSIRRARLDVAARSEIAVGDAPVGGGGFVGAEGGDGELAGFHEAEGQ